MAEVLVQRCWQGRGGSTFIFGSVVKIGFHCNLCWYVAVSAQYMSKELPPLVFDYMAEGTNLTCLVKFLIADLFRPMNAKDKTEMPPLCCV